MSIDSRKNNIERILAWQPPQPCFQKEVRSQFQWLKSRELCHLADDLELLSGTAHTFICRPVADVRYLRMLVRMVSNEAQRIEEREVIAA